ncbi:MmcQ/YjbR family DNA-binding protein [Pseudomonas sp. R5(2019)]|uniref:MmcQ/YjbR family DNA-binding protein n=1 Tax=Pseudomonas sp. R5(2019) TaxID=2697566 RepID=UPI001412633F|nr:MmcQ/YjbR family DNA-binding protein [Pseudomonas sp. R5(2019)]NBA98161.1 MmcQ/YjbR family DNA-binding protein [Pseudomonas sp. R5(2019)]
MKQGQSLSEQEVVELCLSLPGAREDYKWGGIRVFSVAGNKMFAVLDLAGAGLSFKVDSELFLGYVDRPGVRPAPYLARAYWISLQPPYPLARAELADLLERSHQLVVNRLPKRLQVGLKR